MIGTPGTASATRIVLLGSGELGREVAIEAVRLGCEVVACDRYPGAPAMAAAHRSHVLTMSEPDQLRTILNEERERPCARLIIVPEIEAIATEVLAEFEADGAHVVPNAQAAQLTMDREGIRRLAAEELGLATSPYEFCDSEASLAAAADRLELPVRDQTDHVVVGQGSVGCAQRRGHPERMDLCRRGRPRRRRPRDLRGLRGL